MRPSFFISLSWLYHIVDLVVPLSFPQLTSIRPTLDAFASATYGVSIIDEGNIVLEPRSSEDIKFAHFVRNR